MNPTNQATQNIQGATKNVIEFQANLMDKDNQPLASVRGVLWPKLLCGDFRLSSSEEAHRILAKATSLQTSDNRLLQLLRPRLCTAVHPEPHVEFDYTELD